MQSVDEIIIPHWLIPVDVGQSVLEDHAVAISQGTIVEIGPVENINKKYDSRVRSVLDDHALIPGLVNAHTHSAMTLFRGFADDMPLMQWLSEHIWPAEARWVSSAFVEDGANLACAEMIRGGTTCFNDMYFFPDVVARCAETAGIRACIGMIVIDFPTVWAQNADEYINKGLSVRDDVRHSSLITTAFAPHAPYTVSDKPLRKIATLSEELDCQVHMHVHETAHEIEESNARYGMRPVERLDQLGLLGPRLVAVHMTQLLPGEIQTVSEKGVNIVHCPESNMKLASGFCPVSELLSAGANICLGTDGASSNNDLDMTGEMRMASLLAKGYSNDPTTLDAYTTLQAATINGARALGLDHVTGSIEAGKKADLVAVDLSRSACQPVYHPVSQVVYSSTRDQVTDVWIAGQRVLDCGEFTTLDEDRICNSARAWRDKIST
jgi:5-methylthioadenosine/S-adenosylhomocysteine deaminase